MKRTRVLVEPNAQVVIKLKANPGQWYAIADGAEDRARRHTLSQIAYRINRGKGTFRTEVGWFEAAVSRQTGELRARYVSETL
jgi:hypothetical protein